MQLLSSNASANDVWAVFNWEASHHFVTAMRECRDLCRAPACRIWATVKGVLRGAQIMLSALVIADCVAFMPASPSARDPVLQVSVRV